MVSRYAVKRILGAVPRILLISFLLFLLIHLPSGGPADIYAGDPSASPADIERIRELWGLDEPLLVQYGTWLQNAVTGNWGRSFAERRSVLTVVWGRLPNTLLLTGTALVFSIIVGFVLGIIGALGTRRGTYTLVQGLAVVGMSIPTFWSGALVILFFSVYLGWIPSGGMYTIGAPFSLIDRLSHLAAPAVVLGSVYVAQWTRYVQSGLSQAMSEDFVRTAKAKGISHLKVSLKHGLPNAAIPLVTILGLEIPKLISGAMVTEVVFSWPGLGRLLTDSLLSRDYPVVMGVLMVLVMVVVLANLLTDFAYSLLDPRVRYDA